MIPLVNISVFMPVPRCFHHRSSVIVLDFSDGDSSESFLIVQDYFGYPEFALLYDVDYFSFKVCKEFCWDFDRDCIQSIDGVW